MRYRRESKSGEYLHKRALFKVFVGKKIFRIPFVSKPNEGFSAADLERCEERVIDYIDEKLPRLEFRRVVVGPAQINYIACGTKPPQGEKKDEARIGDNAGHSEESVLGTGRAGAQDRSSVSESSDGD